MLFKRFEFYSLDKFTTRQLRALRSYSTLITFIVFCITLAIVQTMSGIFLRGLLFGLFFFFLAYWVVSIFTYLFKKSRYGTYTRVIQRFWKRSLYLFWLLEIGLFCIYLFLTVISPQEVPYMLDNAQLFFLYGNDLRGFFNGLLRPLFIILLTNVYILAHKFNAYQGLTIAIITLLLLYGLFEDFTQFYSINQHYASYNWVHTINETAHQLITPGCYSGVWEQELTELKLRPTIHYMYLLIFLKLWHTLFIVYFFLFFENSRFYSNAQSFNIISANLQNFYFLMFFSYILKISHIKALLNYLGTFTYFWFFTNTNGYDMGYVYSLFSLKYVIYLFDDILPLL